MKLEVAFRPSLWYRTTPGSWALETPSVTDLFNAAASANRKVGHLEEPPCRNTKTLNLRLDIIHVTEVNLYKPETEQRQNNQSPTAVTSQPAHRTEQVYIRRSFSPP